MVCSVVCVGVATAICPVLLASFLLTFELLLFRELDSCSLLLLHVPSLALAGTIVHLLKCEYLSVFPKILLMPYYIFV
jgi:hypothetical protein